ncbi:sensor histidine kinase [Desulfuribacillus alkaliarsenatis]|uniref:histidine kinase n=1 Tax=Desulfuribacillus alkaliarsenatis TaxID=766136 RepID=A0A1E5G122_9FIRM|nr:HAMP domain-containing sensor histidine kinase [Desulfuribacillus alkaliarsenatis]OEF96607.1 hypothetical protein BHF68_08165 [Desulfuribacillus alkaliarsenatis]
MRISIKLKLLITYIILLGLPLWFIYYLSVEQTEQAIFQEVEMNVLKASNVLANISIEQETDVLNIRQLATQYSNSVDARFLILNHNREVIVDSAFLLEGNIINNNEIRSALERREGIGYYSQVDKQILQIAVPVIQEVSGARQVNGVVFASKDVTPLFTQLAEYKGSLFRIVMAASVIGFLIAIVGSITLARPIEKLSKSAQALGKGKLGVTVDIRRNDEIGQLANNFNKMSKELERIDKGRTQFIGDVSHELKTPLASIKSLIDAISHGERDMSLVDEYLRDIDGQIDRMNHLIKEILTLTKLEERGLQKSTVSLEESLDEAIQIVKPIAEQQNITIIKELETDFQIDCDPLRIIDVWVNVIDNAIKYSDTQKLDRWIRIYAENTQKGLRINISDNGIGIKPEHLEQIFEKFYRVETSRSRELGGAGIGLSIVKRIIELHNWDIDVKSQYGKGTTFIITIRDSYFFL